MKTSTFVSGMAGQALVCSFLWKTGLMVPSPGQQFIAFFVLMINAIVFMIIEKKHESLR